MICKINIVTIMITEIQIISQHCTIIIKRTGSICSPSNRIGRNTPIIDQIGILGGIYDHGAEKCKI
jgi:hypothetical protein